MEWRNGPNLNDTRAGLVAVVCHDKVYAIGGNNDNNYTVWDTVESIQVSSLLETMETLIARQNNSQWARLQCHLLSARVGCATVIVQNCYVIILCGNTCVHHLSSVDILDMTPHNNNGEPTIMAGRMNLS